MRAGADRWLLLGIADSLASSRAGNGKRGQRRGQGGGRGGSGLGQNGGRAGAEPARPNLGLLAGGSR